MLLLNIVSLQMNLTYLGGILLYICVKVVCCLWVQPLFDTSHQLLITVEELCSYPHSFSGRKTCSSGYREGSQISPSWNFSAVLVFKQLYSYAKHIVMEEHNTRCQHSTLFVPNGPTQVFSFLQYAYDFIIVSCSMSFTIRSASTAFVSTFSN
jgi:hypothetical protein